MMLNDTITSVIAILKKPFRSQKDLMILGDLLQWIDDYAYYTETFTESMKHQLCRVMEYVYYEENALLFRKGDPSDYFYFILSGKVALNTGKKFRGGVMVRVMTQGESLGERGIIQREGRSLTAVTNTDVRLIAIQAYDFRKIMGIKVRHEVRSKISFIRKNIPNTTNLPKSMQEQLWYSLKEVRYTKGQVIPRDDNSMYFIRSGECRIKDAKSTICIVGQGSWLGEEILFESKPNLKHTIVVISDTIYLYKLEKVDALYIFSKDMIEQIKHKYEMIRKERKKILHKKIEWQYPPWVETSNNPYVYASRPAIGSMLRNIKRNISTRVISHRPLSSKIRSISIPRDRSPGQSLSPFKRLSPVSSSQSFISPQKVNELLHEAQRITQSPKPRSKSPNSTVQTPIKIDAKQARAMHQSFDSGKIGPAKVPRFLKFSSRSKLRKRDASISPKSYQAMKRQIFGHNNKKYHV